MAGVCNGGHTLNGTQLPEDRCLAIPQGCHCCMGRSLVAMVQVSPLKRFPAGRKDDVLVWCGVLFRLCLQAIEMCSKDSRLRPSCDTIKLILMGHSRGAKLSCLIAEQVRCSCSDPAGSAADERGNAGSPVKLLLHLSMLLPLNCGHHGFCTGHPASQAAVS